MKSTVWLVWLAACASPCLAQSTLGTLQGSVQDPSGAKVSQATVDLEDIRQGVKRAITTDDRGSFLFPALPPRSYKLTVAKSGFRTWVSEPIILNSGDLKDISVKLTIGQAQESITVIAPVVDVTTSLGTSIDKTFVENLPLNGRTFQALIAITPGAVASPATAETQGQFSVNGERTSSNYFTIDGVSANFAMSSAVRPFQTAGGSLPALSVAGTTAALLPLEAMQEFRIETSAYAPEYGRQPGAQVQITSASGNNAFHGTAYEFFRNDKLDAADWFANRNGLKKPPLRQNNFGAVFGGPIVRDHTFFLATYEGLLLRQPKIASVAVPSMAVRNATPAVLRPYVDAISVPNGAELANGLAQFNASYADPTNLHAGSIKLDHNIGSKLSLFGRYNYSESLLRTRAPAGYAPNTVQVDQYNIWTITAGGTYVISPSILSDTRFNVSSMEAGTREEVTDYGGAVPLPESALYPSFTNRNESAFFFQLTTGVGFVDGHISKNRQKQYNIVQTISWITSRHVAKFGFDYRQMNPDVNTRDFDTAYRFANGTALTTGITQTSQVRGFPVVSYQYRNYSIYGQDQFRLTRRVTVTYGLRWDMNPAPEGRDGFALYPVTGTYPNFALGPANGSFYGTRKNNLAPRGGLSWQLRDSPGRELVLRTGFGIFYDLGAGLNGSISDNGYQRTVSYANAVFPLASSLLQPIPVPAVPPYTISTGMDPNLRLPFSRHWNFALEQALGNDQTISLAYIGGQGRNLLQTAFVFSPNAQFQQLRYIRNTAESDYNAMQLRYQRRLSHGLQALATYTFSRSIDNTSGDDTVFTPVTLLNSSVDRGNSDFDVRHIFNFAFTWEPRLTRGAVAAQRIVNGWGLDTIWRTQSSMPVGVYESRVFPGLSGTLRTRPDLVLGVPLYLYSSAYPGGKALNPAAFRRVTEARQGTLGRNTLRAFPLNQMDISLRRTFALGEYLQLQIRAEAYNIFNHPNFGTPVADLTNAQFGTSQSNFGTGLGTGGINGGLSPLYQAGTPRSFQFAAKLRF